MPNKLTSQFPVQGWKQFLTSRREMLDAFDRAREKSKSHEIETFHGKVAEAEFRKWLTSFLPKRYGVTSGYIISPGILHTEKAPHYDVIIYDQIESPILWVEDFPDVSSQGRSLAIPVEHVYCVLEVKSTFSSTTVRDAIEHLEDLLPLMSDLDASNEKYKLHLPNNFCCGLVFFDLNKDNQFSETALKNIIDGNHLRRFFGGIILRGEGHTIETTGKLYLTSSESPIKSTISKEKCSLISEWAQTESVELAYNSHLGAMIMWGELYFSQFGFDLIALMQGTYEINRLSSLHGLGRSGHNQSQT